MKDETIAIHGGYETDPTTKSVAVPIHQTVAYEFDDAQHGADLFNLAVPGNIYSRIMNPTCDVLEQRVASLESGVGALAVSAGSAAINYSILNIASAGDNIVTVPQLYGGTYTLFAHMLPQQGIEVRFAEDDSAESLEKLIDGRTKAIVLETIGNPAGNIVDVEAVAKMARSKGVATVADNTVATPSLLKPVDYGIDIVVHSLTKYMGGHGTSLGGVIRHYQDADEGAPRKVVAVHLIVTPEYLARMARDFPSVEIYAIRLDRGLSCPEVLQTRPGERWSEESGLNERQYIVPGAGGVGEVLNNAWV